MTCAYTILLHSLTTFVHTFNHFSTNKFIFAGLFFFILSSIHFAKLR